jgi:6-pyruvoyltetrahydropterin/6-carboxytetrahydropterin synthase
MELTRVFYFDAAHTLPEIFGKNEPNLHGHRYTLEVTVNGPVQNNMVMNISEIKRIVNSEILSELDHKHLNEKLEVPSMENLALWIWNSINDKLPISKIRLYETPNNYVTYYGD